MKPSSRSSAKVSPPARVRQTRRKFSAEFKADALRLVQQRRAERMTWAQIGRELDIRPSLLCEWVRQSEDRAAAPGSLAGETLEQEVKRLRRENAILREEREFAKKAAAFFAKESR